MKTLALAALALVGCSPYISGFSPKAAPAGYTRFISPIIQGIKPGEDDMWCQWVQAPLDHDVGCVVLTSAVMVRFPPGSLSANWPVSARYFSQLLSSPQS